MNAASTAEHPATRWYAIVDTAQDERLYDYVQTCAEFQCLISGDVPLELAKALPYLVVLDEGEPLTEVWRREGIGSNWGIAFKSWAGIDDLRLHFKKFLSAKMPDGTVVLFRFYDPRVFRTYLQAASDDERLSIFRAVIRFSVEGTQGLHNVYFTDDRMFDDDHELAFRAR